MPAAFLIHERKLKSTHDELMRALADQLPCLVNGTSIIPLVTDDEKGFTSIDEHLPKVGRLKLNAYIILYTCTGL